MPLYEYECTACRRHTEKIQKFSDVEITVCPFCGGKLERVISAPAIAFKGGGWYADGYGNAKPASSGDAKPSAPPASGDSATKPAGSGDASPAASGAAPASAPASAPAASAGKAGA